MCIRFNTSPLSVRIERQRRCFQEFPLVCVLRGSCALSGMHWRNVRRPYVAQKKTIDANMSQYHQPLPMMNGYFKEATPPPKHSANQKVRNILSTRSQSIRRMAVRWLWLNMIQLIITECHQCGIYSFTLVRWILVIWYQDKASGHPSSRGKGSQFNYQ